MYCVGLVDAPYGVVWVFELYGAAIRCRDFVLWLHTVPGCPGIVEAGTMFHYLKKNVRSCLFVILEKTLVSSLVVQVLIVLDKSFTVYNRFTLRKKISYANLMS
jgi:hypothetical protein